MFQEIKLWRLDMGIPYEKLVRDKIPELLSKKGIPYVARTASEEEYREALRAKLLEEVQEFLEKNEPEEFADVLEVIQSIRLLPEYATVHEVQARKRHARGGFKKRIILKGEK